MVATAYNYQGAIGDAPIGMLSFGSPDVSAAVVTGLGTTASIGTLSVEVDAVLTGLGTTASIGTIVGSPGTQITIWTGQGAVAAIGFPIPWVTTVQTNVPITGFQISAQIGAPSIHQSPNLIGRQVTAQIGVPIGAVYAEGMFLTDLAITTIPQPVTDVGLNIRWSDTEGYSWSDSVQRTIGGTGAYLTSIQIRRLGMSRRGRVFELSWDSPSPTALMGVSITYEDSGT